MSSVTDWVDQQLAFRLAGVQGRRHVLDAQALAACAKVPRIAVMYAGRHRFADVNGYDANFGYDREAKAYKLLQRRRGDDRRYLNFANFVEHWVPGGGCYVMNWCDASGWLYSEPPTGLQVPVLQYVRRREQHGQVVLLPVDSPYMGVGSANLTEDPGTQPFREKIDGVVWRGRYCGTISRWDEGRQFWAQTVYSGETEVAPKPSAMAKFRAVERFRVVRALQGQPWANVGFSTTPKEAEALRVSDWVGDLLQPFVRERLGIAEQRAYKFILVVPGNDIGSSLYWSLMSNSVTLLVENEWETALDAGLQPWVHYAPVQPTLESVQQVFETLRADPQRCEAMIEAARAHMRPYLNPAWRDMTDVETLRQYRDSVWNATAEHPHWSLSRFNRATAKPGDDEE